MSEHRYNPDADRCSCGGVVVFFEDGDDKGDVGEGCEVAGLTWKSVQLGRLGGEDNPPSPGRDTAFRGEAIESQSE